MANSVYWIGADGNIYLKSANGVQNVGSSADNKQNYNLSDNGFESNTLKQSVQAKRIADPNPPKQTAPPTVSGSSGGGSGTTFEDKSNDIAQQNAGLSAVGGYISSGQSAIDKALGVLNGTYDTEAAAAKTSNDSNTNQNKINLTKNQQTALVNAAQGRQGLNATLASLGALNGSGIELATRAVQKGANDDLTGASDNYDTNQQAIDSAYGTFTAADKERRDQARAAAEQAKTVVQNKGLQQQLGYYQNLSNDYAAEGDKANAAKYTSLASSLFPQIASTSMPDTAPTYSAAAYTAPTLASYLSGNSATTVSATPAQNGGIPGLVASTGKKKTAAPVAA